MAMEPKHRPDDSKGCGCGRGDRASDEAQKVQTERHDEHPTEVAQKPMPSRSKGCCCGS